jgi:hypothetical protein
MQSWNAPASNAQNLNRENDLCSILPDRLVAGDCALRFVLPEYQYRTKSRLSWPQPMSFSSGA